MDARDIEAGRIYQDLAWLIPLISPPEEYAEEAANWRSVLKDKLGQGRHRILELGVGGGHNLSHLTGDFDATAVDISPAMLELCRHLNPGVKLHIGDMRNVRLGETFSAVLIHDAISYMLNEEDLLLALSTAAAHLLPGGVLITSPDRFRETFKGPAIEQVTHSQAGRELTYVEYTIASDPVSSTLETVMVYLVREGSQLRVELDRHLTGLFPRATWHRLIEAAGFSVEEREFSLSTIDQPYCLLVGTRR